MIYLVHIDSTRPDMYAQARFLEKSHRDVGIREPLVVLESDERSKFEKYGCIDDYSMYNRYISVIEYIEKNNLQDETIFLLDTDMVFCKKYNPYAVKYGEVVSQEWVGGPNWRDYWKYFDEEGFKGIKSIKSKKEFDNTNPNKLHTPYYMLGRTFLDLYYVSLEVEKILRKKVKWWMTELLSVNYASWYLDLKVKYDTLGAMKWFTDIGWYPDANSKGANLDNYTLIHYANSLSGISGDSGIIKYNMHDSTVMLQQIDNFMKNDKPKTEWDKRVLDFYINAYGWKG